MRTLRVEKSKSRRSSRGRDAARPLPQPAVYARATFTALVAGAALLHMLASSAGAQAPDLVVHIPLVDVSQTNSGVSLEMSAIIENQGNAASGSFRVGFDVGGNTVEVNQGGLAPGEITAAIKTVRLDLAPGAHQLVVTADSANAVAESDETNNSATEDFTLTGPDLVVENLTSSSTPKGSAFIVELEATVRNEGDGAAGRFGVDFVPSAGSVKGNAAIRELAPGAAATATGRFTIDAGTYDVHIVADPGDRVLEYNESNNEADFVITVP